MKQTQFSSDFESEHDRLVRRRRELERDMKRHRDNFKLAAKQYRDIGKRIANEWENPSELES